MTKMLIIILYLILTAFIIKYIDNGIRTFDIGFYFGKDDGYLLRFGSIIILNSVFFLLLAAGKKLGFKDYLIQFGLGFMTAIILGVVGYLVLLGADYYGLIYHITTVITCYSSYFGFKKLNWC